MSTSEGLGPQWNMLYNKLLPKGVLPPSVDQGLVVSSLETANLLHPERVCVKKVPAALQLETERGVISLYAINGVPDSTPRHLEEYRVGSLAELAKYIPSEMPNADLAERLSTLNPNRRANCINLAKELGTERCLKDFPINATSTNGDGHKSSLPSEKFCPSSRAGCSERILLHWAQYAVRLQEQLTIFGNLMIQKVVFAPSSDDVYISYSNDEGVNWKGYTTKVIHDNDGHLPREVKQSMLMTEFIPCFACAKAIVKAGVQRVDAAHYSRHTTPSREEVIDRGDLHALHLLQRGGVNVLSANVQTKAILATH